MFLQLNLATLAVAGQMAWKKTKPILFRDTFLLPTLGFLGVIFLWWFAATFLTDLMPTPLEALIDSREYANPFFRKGPGNLGLGWLLIASLRRVILGFLLGAVVAIPLGFLIGMSRPAFLALNPLVQIFKPVSPLAWLPIALAIFNLAEPSAIFVIFITSLWPTIINTALGVASVNPDYLDVARVLEMPQWKRVIKIILPASLPYIFTGLRISLGIAWLVIVAVEMLTGGVGIGFFVWDQWNRLNLSSVFLAVFVIGITGLLLDYGLGQIQALVTHHRVQA
ncbi:Nitrate transport permease protein NrtB [Planktothrix tepida]|uniref:Nitrate transport permease protein NrtB n=2 Tax=Planktothrix TaxID=54304 RepID=A0A9W4CE27_9CYAN|nr:MULTISPECIES: nitrate ABC transporter permease [Planktothrix]CAD5914365.1 Nitrate transport permease protein NrtB [Planktothrix pseudagardhii]CAD5983505.1 Nitrate transport permease protein NrtB [Planktothrix tepida]CUR32283.1 putative nitrate ABC transporter (permease protein) (ntrB-like protein) [Planktothrix tepida PCC 9214]